MPQSKCPSCSGTRFETTVNEPRGSKVKVVFVQCAGCGTVVGTTDFYQMPRLLKKIADRLGIQNFYR